MVVLTIYSSVSGKLLKPMPLDRLAVLELIPEIDLEIHYNYYDYTEYLQAVKEDVETYHLFCQLWKVEPAYDIEDILEDDAEKISFLVTRGYW